MKVFVTGANGFVGRAVVETLLARGHAVRAGVRDAASRAGVPSGAEAVETGDITAEPPWATLLGGCEAVVHLAARVHLLRDASPDPLAEYRNANTAATHRLARGAITAGVRRLVFASTAKVLGERSRGRPFTDDDTPAPEDHYARSKLEAENALRELAKSGAFELAILRPPLVYGPGVRANFLRLMRWIESGVPLPFARVANRRSLIYVGNLADVIAACVVHPGAAGRTFLASDHEDVSTPELARRIGRALGKPARLLPVPDWLLRIAGAAAGHAAEIDRLLSDFVVDTCGLRESLAWKPPFTMSQGLDATSAWYRRWRGGAR